jgi:hypothetical protein
VERQVELTLVSDVGTNLRNGKASLILERLTQVVERSTMMVDSFDTDN